MSVCYSVPISIKCDICEKRLEASYDLVMDGRDLDYWKSKWQRKLAQKALDVARENDWLVAYGVTVCPECSKKLAEGQHESITLTGGLLGALDNLLLPNRLIAAAKRKEGVNE